ncbi:MAG: hypothetical protein AB7E55_30620 [Pigmentiphaga sp.]
MTKLTTVQAAHTYGVLDPLTQERRDTKFLQSALSGAENIIILPQGGYSDRGGTWDRAGARRQLEDIALSEGMCTLPNGGTAADLLNPDTEITTSAAAGARFVLFEVDLGAAKTVHFIDIGGVHAETSGADAALIAEWWDGAVWQPFGNALKLTIEAETRRFASGAPGHSGHAAQMFRVCVDATGDAAGAITFTHAAFRAEGAALSLGLVRRFTPEQGKRHQLVFTDRNIDVFVAGVWQTAIPYPAGEDILHQVQMEPRFDSILAFHQEMAPQRIFRMGSSTEWSCSNILFENVPLVDFGGVYTNGVTEVQEVSAYDLIDGGSFDLTLEGNTTTSITVSDDGPANALLIKAALEDLPGVAPGLTVTNLTTGGSNPERYKIQFTGEGNANRDWLQMGASPLDNKAYFRVKTVTKGRPAGEPIMSEERGWPAVGRIVQQRLVMTGFKSRPNHFMASVTGEPFNIDTELDASRAALVYEIEAGEANVMRDIVNGRTLLFFGSEKIAYLKNLVLSATEVPEFGFSDAPGIAPGLPTTSSDNGIFYVQEGGDTLRLLSYTELEQNFVGENASVLSAHLIKQPTDLARRRAYGKVDADMMLMPMEDGTLTSLTVMRTQEVSGFAPWETDGKFLSVMSDTDRSIWMLCQRTSAGQDSIRLEEHDPVLFLDEAEQIVLGAPTNSLSGLDRYSGRSIWIQEGDNLHGPFEVTAGEATLQDPVAGTIIVGTWRPPVADDMDVMLETETGRREARLKRVSRLVVSLYETTSLAIAVNDAPAFNVPLRSNADTIMDEGPLARPVTARIEVEGMHGFSRHGRSRITQLFPGRLTVRSVQKDIAG